MTKLDLVDNITGEKLVESFQRKSLNKFEKPKFFLSDQGKQYTSMIFRTFLSSSGIRQVFASSYNPTGNSVSEKLNQTISFGLRGLRGHPIEHIIEIIEFSINNTQNRTLGMSSSEILRKHSIVDPLNRKPEIDEQALKERIIEKSRKEERKRTAEEKPITTAWAI